MSSPALYYLKPRKFIRFTQGLNSIDPNFISSNRSTFICRSPKLLNPRDNRRLMATEEPIVVAEVAVPAVDAAVTVAVEEPAVGAAEGKPKKARKTSGKSKPRTPSLHPPYFEV